MAWADSFNIPRLSTSMRLPSRRWLQLHNLIEAAIKVISLQDYDLLRLRIEDFYRFSAGCCLILLYTVLESLSFFQVFFWAYNCLDTKSLWCNSEYTVQLVVWTWWCIILVKVNLLLSVWTPLCKVCCGSGGAFQVWENWWVTALE